MSLEYILYFYYENIVLSIHHNKDRWDNASVKFRNHINSLSFDAVVRFMWHTNHGIIR